MVQIILGFKNLHSENSEKPFCCFLFHLARNAVYLVSQSSNTKPALGLLTPNEVDHVGPANQIFSIFLILVFVLYSKRAPAFHQFFSSLNGDSLLHEVLHKVRFYCLNCFCLIIFFNNSQVNCRPLTPGSL